MEHKLIWRSETGQRAWASVDSGLPIGYRSILGLVQSPTRAEDIPGALSNYSVRQIESWLDELETLCFIQVSRADDSSFRAAA